LKLKEVIINEAGVKFYLLLTYFSFSNKNNQKSDKVAKLGKQNSADDVTSSESEYEYNLNTDDPLSSELNKKRRMTQTTIINELDQINLHSHEHAIAPVAWIIICSEGLHNFIDGLSIGAQVKFIIVK
jgi:zinc transporter ZupT